MPKTMKLEPNYPALVDRFFTDALAQIEEHTRTNLGDPAAHTEARAVRKVLVSLNIAMQSVTSIAEFMRMRNQFGDAVGKLADAVDRVENQIWEQSE